MDREWYQVVRSSKVLLDELNEDQADAGAARLAEDSDDPVCVVRYQRTEVRVFQREVVVTSQDMETE